mmetsp:Transcript_25854/g.48701  ORF Transcript_25854/g.48701 Transcript_25854/m.48701 type:complete len:104 (+) Transcript_25854:1266-1577(+)
MRDDKEGGRGTGTVKDVGEEDSQVTVGEGERVRFVRKDFRWVEVDSSTQSDQPVDAPSRPELCRSFEAVIVSVKASTSSEKGDSDETSVEWRRDVERLEILMN